MTFMLLLRYTHNRWSGQSTMEVYKGETKEVIKRFLARSYALITPLPERLPLDRSTYFQATFRQPQSPMATQSRSPGVSSTVFRAQPPDLRFASLMDMDFAVSCPLVRRSRLVSGSCPSTRTFARRFLQTSPRGDSPCVVANPSPPSGWVEDFHLQATEHAQHTTKPLAR